MSRKAVIRFMALLLVVALVSSCFVSRTFALYRTDNDITIKSGVVEWSFTLNEQDFTKLNDSFAFDLFDASDAGAQIIAPGTSGNFEFRLKNTSNVYSQVSVTFNVTHNGVPVKIYANEELLDDGSKIIITREDENPIGPDETITVPVSWSWNRSSETATDTTIQQADKSVTVIVTVMARMCKYESTFTAP